MSHLFPSRPRAPAPFVALASGLALVLAGCSGSSGHGGGGGNLSSTAASTSAASPSAVTSGAQGSLQVQISSPTNLAQVAPLTTLTLAGQALGASGAPASGAVLTWTSSIDGPLGTGSPLVVGGLSSGIHRISLDATDASGASGQAAIDLLVAGPPAGAQGQELVDYLLSLPSRLLGDPWQFPPSVPSMIAANPCDVNGIAGNGALAAGFSSNGTITVLRYPSPSYEDQVCWLSKKGNPPGFGAIEDMGVFAGLSVDLAGTRVTTWLRDATWTHAQSYLSPDSAVLVTVHESAALGLRVTHQAFAHPTDDVLVEHFQVERLAHSPVGPQVSLLYYENLSPCATKIPYAPLLDGLGDALNDFACGYHSGDDALVHFKPRNADYGQLVAFTAAPHANLQADVDAWLDGAGTAFGPGVYFAIGSDAPSSAHQVGVDAGDTRLAPSAPERSAYDACRDGVLPGHPIAFVQANGALARALDLTPGSAEATFYLAAGEVPDGPQGARDRLKAARARPYTDHLAAVEQDWHTWLSRARLPQPPADAQVVAFAKRSLIVAREATDRNTGAIVASVATQLPYGEDWPRDGAFINAALDAAGYPEMVEAHNAFYARVQRQGWIFPGSFDMNFYADGTPGGPIPLEIDEAAFGVWTMSAHASTITDPAKQKAYLATVYPAIRRGADFIAGWRDPATGLQLPANEDDNLSLTAGLHGATAILTGLDAAIVAGPLAGESPSVVQGWQTRRDELAKAIDARFWDPTQGTFFDNGGSGNPLGPPSQPTAWLVWPAQMLAPTDPRLASTCDWLFAAVKPALTGQVAESAYDGKTTLSLAHAWQNDPTKRDALRTAFTQFIHELPTEGTLHVGEFYKRVQRNGAGAWQSENDVPHVWEHMLLYHTAVELYP